MFRKNPVYSYFSPFIPVRIARSATRYTTDNRYRGGLERTTSKTKEHAALAHARVARADRAGHRALACPHREFQFRSKKTHALLSNRCRRALAGWDGHCPPRMDTCGVRLRSEQPRQLCSCRRAAASSRHSPAPEPRVCLLGRHLVGYNLLDVCCAPSASTRWRRQHCW